MEIVDMTLDSLNPYVRKAGLQGAVEWKHTNRRIYDFQWMYCYGGNAYIELDGTIYTITTGSLVLIRPNTPHKFYHDNKKPAQIIWVHFDFNYREDVYRLEELIKNNQSGYFKQQLTAPMYIRQNDYFEKRFALPSYIQVKKKALMLKYFEQILNVFQEHNSWWQLNAKANLLLIIQNVLEQIGNRNQSYPQSNKEVLAENMKRYVREHYHCKISMQEISNYFGYNKDYLGKIFMDNTKDSLNTYINIIRVNKAMELLKRTNLTIKAIAELVGFSDVYYFSKKMKEETGLSPSEWRKQNKG